MRYTTIIFCLMLAGCSDKETCAPSDEYYETGSIVKYIPTGELVRVIKETSPRKMWVCGQYMGRFKIHFKDGAAIYVNGTALIKQEVEP